MVTVCWRDRDGHHVFERQRWSACLRDRDGHRVLERQRWSPCVGETETVAVCLRDRDGQHVFERQQHFLSLLNAISNLTVYCSGSDRNRVNHSPCFPISFYKYRAREMKIWRMQVNNADNRVNPDRDMRCARKSVGKMERIEK